MGLLDIFHGKGGGGLLGNGAQPTPQQVQTPANAPPNFGQRLNAVLQSDAWLGTMAGLASGSDLQDSLGRASVGYVAGKRSDRLDAEDKARKDQLNVWIKAKSAGLPPEDAALLASNPGLAASYAANVLKPKEYEKPATTADITEFNYAKQNGYKGSFIDWKSQGSGAAGGGEYGLSPVWGTGPDGKPSLVQLGKNGQPIQPQMPEGFQIARDPIKVDGGTNWILLDPQTRQPVGTIPKDVAGAAQQGAMGKAQGEAEMQIPAARQSAAMVAAQIDDIKNDPALDRSIGPFDSWRPNISGGANRFQAKLDQLQGGAFLQARQMLKGGGAITDFEGRKAEAAFARLNTAQSETDFRKALDDFNEAIQQGVANLEAQAARGGTMQPPQLGQPDYGQSSQGGADGWRDLGGGNRIRQLR